MSPLWKWGRTEFVKNQGPDVEMGTLVQQPAGASDDASSHLLGNPSAPSVGDISAMALAPPPPPAASLAVLPASEDAGSSSSVRASNHHLQEDGGRQPIAGTARTNISHNLLGCVARHDDEERSWHVKEKDRDFDMYLWFGYTRDGLKTRSVPLKTALLDFCHHHSRERYGSLFDKEDSSNNPFGLRKELFTAIVKGDDETARNLLVVNTDAAADRRHQQDGETKLNPSSFPQQQQQQHGDHNTNKYNKDYINGSLLFAALFGRTALALDLVKQYGANLMEAILSNVLPCTAFDLAAIADHKETLEALLLLMSHVPADDKQQMAAGGGSSAALGRDSSAGGDVMDAALHWATFAGSFDCVKLLVEKAGVSAIERGMTMVDAGINKRWTLQRTSESYCSFESRLYREVRFAAYLDTAFMRNGLLLKSSPLHLAVMFDREEILRFFVQQIPVMRRKDVLYYAGGLRVNDKWTLSSLHLAAVMGASSVMSYLLSREVRPTDSHDVRRLCNERDPLGRSALLIAVRRGHKHCVDALLRCWPQIGTAVDAVANYNFVNAEDKNGNTPLLQAIHGHGTGWNRGDYKDHLTLAVIEAILKADASFDWRQRANSANFQSNKKLGQSALFFAARTLSAPCVQLLLQYGALVGVKDRRGESALQVMAGSFTQKTLAALLKRQFTQSLSWKIQRKSCSSSSVKFTFAPIMPAAPASVRESKLSRSDTAAEDDRLKNVDGDREMGVIMDLIAVGQSDLLAHPLCRAFLDIKWRMVRMFFLLYLLLHMFFTSALTWYLVVIFSNPCIVQLLLDDDPHNQYSTAHHHHHHHQEDNVIDGAYSNCSTSKADDERAAFLGSWRVLVPFCSTIGLAALLSAKEALQATMAGWSYPKSPRNLLQIITLGLTVYLLIIGLGTPC